MANLPTGGLRLTVEQFNEFMQQTGQASEAMTQLGQSAQASAKQVSQSSTSWGDISTQLGKLSSEQLVAVQKRYDELSTGLLSNKQSVDANISANDLYAQALREVTSSADSAGQAISGTGKKTKDSGEDAKDASVGFIALGAALTAISAKATEVVLSTTLVAGRIKELEILLEVTRKNAVALAEEEGRMSVAMGLNTKAVQDEVQAVRDLHLSGVVANETVAQMIRYQLDWTKASDLAQLAMNAATFAAQDSSQALEGLIKGITTLQPRILRTYGIMVNLNEAYRVYAKENNLAAENLTQLQRQQAALNSVLAQAPRIAGAYEASLGSATKQIRSIYTDTQNLAEVYGEFLEPALAGAVQGLRSFMQDLTNLGGPTRAFITGVATSGSALLTLTTGAATLLPLLSKLKVGFSGLAQSIGISGIAMTGLALGIPVVIGVVSALIEAEKAHIAEAAQVAASTKTYPEYVRALEIADEKSRILTLQLWKQVQAQEAANQAAYAARILEEQRDMYTRLQQAIDRFGGSLDKAFEAWKAGAENLDEFQLAIMADESALYKMAIRLEEDEQKAWAWVQAVSEWARETIRAREETERLAAIDLPEYIEDITLGMTRLTTATDGYSRTLQRIINMPFSGVGGEWINPDDVTKFTDDINKALDDAFKAQRDAAVRRNRSLEDLDTKYLYKAIDIQNEYIDAVRESEADLAAFHAGTLQELLDIDREYLQDRQDAWTKYQQDLADAERDLQRDIDDASRDRIEKLADLETDYARDREDALRDLNQDMEDMAEEHAQNLIDIEQERQQSLLDLEQEYQDRLFDIQNLAAQRLRDLQDEYDEKASDARLVSLRKALELLESEGIRVSAAYEDILRRAFLAGETDLTPFIVQADVHEIYAQLLEELSKLNDDQRWEEEDLSDDIDREQGRRLEDLEEWLSEEQAAIEAAYTEKVSRENERFAEEQEARRQDYERKLEDLKRSHEREHAEIELNHQRRLDDIRQQAERERGELAQTYARRLEDLEIEYNRERELIRNKLEEQNQVARDKFKEAMEDIKEAYRRERNEINNQYDDTIEDVKTKMGDVVMAAAEKWGLLPEALRPTYRITKDDWWGFLFNDSDSLAAGLDAFIEFLHQRFDWRSPSGLMIDFGKDLVSGLRKGVGNESLNDIIGESFNAQALEANIRAAMPVNMASVPMGMGRGAVTNTRNSNLVVNAQYQHQSEASLRDDLSLWSSMMGVW